MKNRSFLNPYNKEYGKVWNASDKLGLDTIVRSVFSDFNSKEKVLSILNNIVLDKETIYYRQELVTEFVVNSALFQLFLAEIKNIEKCYSQYNTTKAQKAKNKIKSEISITDMQMQMRDYGYTLKMLLGIYSRLKAILEENKIKSTGLKDLSYTLNRKIRSEGFLELGLFLDKLEQSGGSYCFSAVITDMLCFDDIKYYFAQSKEKEDKVSIFKRSKDKDKLEVDNLIKENNRRAILEVYNRITVKLENIFESLFEEIAFLPDEFIFFEFAKGLYDILSTKSKEICFPKIEGHLNFVEAIDPYLIVKYEKEDYKGQIFGNDISLLRNESALVYGKNNTGKTVFLRTIGLLQILAQNGLFVPCKEATTVCFEKIVMIFSGEEKDTNIGGRFEKEVIDIKDTIDIVDNNSLVIINEIFQSTFAKDGEKALFDILEYFTAINVKWITVTHLMGIKDKRNLFSGEVKGFETTGKENDYKIIKVGEYYD